jgi:hypothetical protein
MKQLSVTIGQNIGNTPMTATNWESFKRAVKLAIYRGYIDASRLETLFESESEFAGIWEGVPEISYRVTVLIDTVATPYDIETVRSYLRYLLDRYKQDAIAISYADSVLIER